MMLINFVTVNSLKNYSEPDPTKSKSMAIPHSINLQTIGNFPNSLKKYMTCLHYYNNIYYVHNNIYQ